MNNYIGAEEVAVSKYQLYIHVSVSKRQFVKVGCRTEEGTEGGGGSVSGNIPHCYPIQGGGQDA